MKNIFPYAKSIIVILTMLHFSASAQTSLGVAAGINFANVQKLGPAGDINNNRTARMNYRLFADIGLKGAWALQPELNYTQKAYNRYRTCTSDPSVFSGYDQLHKLNYLNFNFLVKYYLSDKTRRAGKKKEVNPIRCYAAIGLYGGGALSGELYDRCSDISVPYPFTAASSTRVRKSNFGALIGFGALFSTDPVNLFLEARYGHDIFHNNEDANANRDGQIRNTIITIDLGAQFRL